MLNRLARFIAVVCALLFVLLVMASANQLFGQFNVMPEPFPQFFTDTGAVCNGCLLRFFVTGTVTPANVYQDTAGSTPWTQPITLDATGRATAGIFLDSTVTYRARLYTAADVQMRSQDSVRAPIPSVFTGTSNYHAKFTSTGTSIQNSCESDDGTTLTITCSALTSAITYTRPIPDVSQDVVISSGAPTVVQIGTAVTVVSLTSGTAAAVSTWFKVPNDARTSGSLNLRLTYSVDTGPGVTNNKVKLNMVCVVNGTIGTPTTDTITLANNTTPASYSATLNVCAASSYAANDDVVATITRDVTVANNAVVNFQIRTFGFSYVATQGLAALPKTFLEWLLFLMLGFLLRKHESKWKTSAKFNRAQV